jgi:tRNA 5-methylaminomethyl-2-thiouridine biosynthesis bifunctional protein
VFDDLKTAESYLPDIFFDVWYLDGFSPKENPEMWTDDFFRYMGQKSFENATFSTFSAAGFIRRGLEKNGFEVQKIKGFNRKRQMLKGFKKQNS